VRYGIKQRAANMFRKRSNLRAPTPQAKKAKKRTDPREKTLAALIHKQDGTEDQAKHAMLGKQVEALRAALNETRALIQDRKSVPAASDLVDDNMDNVTHDMYMGHWRRGEMHGLGVLIEGSEAAMEKQLEVCHTADQHDRIVVHALGLSGHLDDKLRPLPKHLWPSTVKRRVRVSIGAFEHSKYIVDGPCRQAGGWSEKIDECRDYFFDTGKWPNQYSPRGYESVPEGVARWGSFMSTLARHKRQRMMDLAKKWNRPLRMCTECGKSLGPEECFAFQNFKNATTGDVWEFSAVKLLDLLEAQASVWMNDGSKPFYSRMVSASAQNQLR